VISSSPRQSLLSHNPRPQRPAKTPPSAPASPLTTGLSSATMALSLFLALIFLAWKWHHASALADAERHNAERSWTLVDGVLGDLKSLRADASRLDMERKDLLRALDTAQRNGIALEADLAVWQQSHHQLESQSAQALNQWSSYSEQLQQTLGTARVQLQETSSTLQQEREAATQSIAQLDSEKNTIAAQKAAAEREAEALDRKARSLDSENNGLANNLSQARSTISSLESVKRSLECRNNELSGDINRLHGCISSLESRNSQLCSEISCLNNRISCLENELSRARSDNRNDDHRDRR
jgi:chromosome segregation ATPase